MAQRCDFVVNGRRFHCEIGETILDAAIGARILIPHDCSTGQCETCRVRVYAGEVNDEGTRRGNTVLACQAKIIGEAVVEFDAAPDPVRRDGAVTSVLPLTPDILEVKVRLSAELPSLPGQYVKVSFDGFPSRDYSPTVPVDEIVDLNAILLHIRRMPGGIVSSELGRQITVGTRARVYGPFGNAFHRRGEGRIILVSSGTGFAPIWAIARASRFREPEREMFVVAGARHASNLYMRDALQWLRGTGVQDVILTASGPKSAPDVAAGRPTAHLPRLLPTDTIYVAGASAMVTAVELLAETAAATCYADPFLPSTVKWPWRQRLAKLVRNRFSAQLRSPENPEQHGFRL
jgi:naphthalene 1,2-dioxygenase ferredoxin reductase component